MCNRIVAIIGPGASDCMIREIISSNKKVEVIIITEEQMQSIEKRAAQPMELTINNPYDEMLKELYKICFTPFLDSPPNVRGSQGFSTDKKLQHQQTLIKRPPPVHTKKTNPRHRGMTCR
jgi:hypothetical protein